MIFAPQQGLPPLVVERVRIALSDIGIDVILAPLQGSSPVIVERLRIANYDCVGHDWEGYEDNRQNVRVVWILGGLCRS